MMDRIENFVNEFTDRDMSWWPLLFLRPAKDRDIDNLLQLKLTLIWGSSLGILFLLIHFPRIGTSTIANIVFAMLLGWVLFFVGYRLTAAYFWNRRARRLRGA